MNPTFPTLMPKIGTPCSVASLAQWRIVPSPPKQISASAPSSACGSSINVISRGISGIRKIPALTGGAPNDFLTRLFAEYNNIATVEAEQTAQAQAAYEAAMMDGSKILATVKDAVSANAAMADFKAIKHALTSARELGAEWNKKIKGLGLEFDAEAHQYFLPAPPEKPEVE